MSWAKKIWKWGELGWTGEHRLRRAFLEETAMWGQLSNLSDFLKVEENLYFFKMWTCIILRWLGFKCFVKTLFRCNLQRKYFHFKYSIWCCCCCEVASVVSDSVRPHRRQPTRLPCPWYSPGKNTGVGCRFLLQFMKVKSESEVTQSCLTLSDPMDCSLPGSCVRGISQARVLEWGAIAFSEHLMSYYKCII